MKCPSCGLYHPAFYERCIACSTLLKGGPEPDLDKISETKEQPNIIVRSGAKEVRKSTAHRSIGPVQIPTRVGILLALLIIVVFASATVFFLTQLPDDQRLLNQGKHQLALGQYAFAVETLSKVSAQRPNDPNVFLALARAYIGIDQVDKAWESIMHAQQLGVGVIADPELASELANYYRQRGQYDKAIDLLRPLVNASVPGKKAELADLDALKGDECIERGDFEQAQRSWEEVQQLNEGSRLPEAQARLSTIYYKLAGINEAKHEDEKALDYLNKLNSIGENTKNYLMAADILEGKGRFKEAIEQIQKGQKLLPDDQFLKSRLAQLFMHYGKELVAKGETDAGYGYLQQANSIDTNLVVPNTVLRNLTYKIENSRAKLAGQIWNAGDKSINTLNMRVQLYDTAKEESLWIKEERIIDEFVPPLAPQQTKSFVFYAPIALKGQDPLAFKVYLDGNFYESYPLRGNMRTSTSIESTPSAVELPNRKEEIEAKTNKIQQSNKQIEEVETDETKAIHPKNKTEESISPEEKTMKDLEY